MNRATEIKAQLYDLQYHNCNGFTVISTHEGERSLTISDGFPAVHGYKDCDFCSEIMKLKNELATLDERAEVDGSI